MDVRLPAISCPRCRLANVHTNHKRMSYRPVSEMTYLYLPPTISLGSPTRSSEYLIRACTPTSSNKVHANAIHVATYLYSSTPSSADLLAWPLASVTDDVNRRMGTALPIIYSARPVRALRFP